MMCVSGSCEEEVPMGLRVGDRVEEKALWAVRPGRIGVIREVLRSTPADRYRIRCQDGHESVLTPAAGSLAKLPVRAASGACTSHKRARGRPRDSTEL
jgi:Domain of unknown function (DUF1918)